MENNTVLHSYLLRILIISKACITVLKCRFLEVLYNIRNRWTDTAQTFSYTIGLDCIILEGNSTVARPINVGCRILKNNKIGLIGKAGFDIIISHLVP